MKIAKTKKEYNSHVDLSQNPRASKRIVKRHGFGSDSAPSSLPSKSSESFASIKANIAQDDRDINSMPWYMLTSRDMMREEFVWDKKPEPVEPEATSFFVEQTCQSLRGEIQAIEQQIASKHEKLHKKKKKINLLLRLIASLRKEEDEMKEAALFYFSSGRKTLEKLETDKSRLRAGLPLIINDDLDDEQQLKREDDDKERALADDLTNLSLMSTSISTQPPAATSPPISVDIHLSKPIIQHRPRRKLSVSSVTENFGDG